MKRKPDSLLECKEKRQKVQPSSPRQYQEDILPIAIKKVCLTNTSNPEKITKNEVPKSEPLSVTYENEVIFMTNLMLQCGRNEDALSTMQGFVSAKLETANYLPSEEELSLLLEAYHKVNEKLMNAWNEWTKQKSKEQNKHFSQFIIKRLSKTCEDIIETGEKIKSITKILDKLAIPPVTNALSFKLQTDYALSLFKINPSSESLKALESLYQNAFSFLQEKLPPPSHYLSLRISLDFCRFYLKLMKDNTKGMDIATKAYDAALKDVNFMEASQSHFKESVVYLQKIRELIQKYCK